MVLSIPRLLGIVAVLEAWYLIIAGCLELTGLGGSWPTDRYTWLILSIIALFAGATALWLPRPPHTLISALVRTALVFAVIAITAWSIVWVLG
jgi:hypothetical protein